nr:MAG TPA: hypothetical protein [Caudoviricetes sp.]
MLFYEESRYNGDFCYWTYSLAFCIKENAQHEGISVSSKTYTGN